jgi:hypothetical protein
VKEKQECRISWSENAINKKEKQKHHGKTLLQLLPEVYPLSKAWGVNLQDVCRPCIFGPIESILEIEEGISI